MVKFLLLEKSVEKQKKITLKRKDDFLERIGKLLDEGYTFHDSVMILLPHHVNHLSEARNRVREIMHNGEGITAVLEMLGFDKQILLPIEIAQHNGNLPFAVHVAGEHVRRLENIKERLKKILMYPIVLFFFIAILFILFRTIFIPNMEQLVNTQSNSDSGIIDLPNLLLRLPDVLLLGFGLLFATVIGFLWWVKKQETSVKLRHFLSIPYLSYYFRILYTSIFAREMGNMLISGMSMQEALEVLIDQDRHDVVRELSMSVKGRVIGGESLSIAVSKIDGFSKEFYSFVSHGEHGGHIAKELLIYSDLLNERMEETTTKTLSIIQPLLFCILAICILSAYLALLLPMYGLFNTI